MVEGEYSHVADELLDALEAGPVQRHTGCLPVDLQRPGTREGLSTAITTREGIRLRPPVVGHPPYKVFWSSDGWRAETVLPHR